jgi:hypothetical protein
MTWEVLGERLRVWSLSSAHTGQLKAASRHRSIAGARKGLPLGLEWLHSEYSERRDPASRIAELVGGRENSRLWARDSRPVKAT